MTGWGTTEVSYVSPVLLKTVVNIVSNSVCQEVMGEDRIFEGMICAGAENKDTCLVMIVNQVQGRYMIMFRVIVEALW